MRRGFLLRFHALVQSLRLIETVAFRLFDGLQGYFRQAAGTQYLPVTSAGGRLFIPVSCLLAGILASFFPDALADFLLCFSLYPVQQLSGIASEGEQQGEHGQTYRVGQ